MDYQYEAGNVAQMNIYWIVVYSIFIVLGTHVSSGLMKTVFFIFHSKENILKSEFQVKETAIIIHKIACRNESLVLLNNVRTVNPSYLMEF